MDSEEDSTGVARTDLLSTWKNLIHFSVFQIDTSGPTPPSDLIPYTVSSLKHIKHIHFFMKKTHLLLPGNLETQEWTKKRNEELILSAQASAIYHLKMHQYPISTT